MSVLVQIRDVDQTVRDQLKARAARSGMSFNSYLRDLLNSAAARPVREDVLARIQARTESATASATAIIRPNARFPGPRPAAIRTLPADKPGDAGVSTRGDLVVLDASVVVDLLVAPDRPGWPRCWARIPGTHRPISTSRWCRPCAAWSSAVTSVLHERSTLWWISPTSDHPMGARSRCHPAGSRPA